MAGKRWSKEQREKYLLTIGKRKQRYPRESLLEMIWQRLSSTQKRKAILQLLGDADETR